MENTGLLALLCLDKYDDLRRMYLLFRRVEGGLAVVRSMMADYVKENGRQLVMVRVWVCGCVGCFGVCVCVCVVWGHLRRIFVSYLCFKHPHTHKHTRAYTKTRTRTHTHTRTHIYAHHRTLSGLRTLWNLCKAC